MKKFLALKSMLLLLSLFMLTVAFAYAAYWVYSNTQTVTLTDYTLTLTVLYKGLEANVTGNLTYQSAAIPNAEVHIFINDTEIGTCTTNIVGLYLYNYVALHNETDTFKAGLHP